VPGLLPERAAGDGPRPGHGDQSLASVRRRDAGGRLQLGPGAAVALARYGHRRPQLVPRRARRDGRADVEAAQALADVATIAILQHRASLEAQVLNQQLQHALNSRIVIEQAKGMVAQREGLNMEQAFSALRVHARNHNLRLVAVAEAVISGALAPQALDRLPRGGPAPRRMST